MNSAVILAAGSSRRMGRQGKKELLLLDGRPVLLHSFRAFLETGLFHQIIIAYPEGFKEAIESILPPCKIPVELVQGGGTRQESVKYCLDALHSMDKAQGLVLIHDGARPWVSQEIIHRITELAQKKGAAIPVEPSTSAMKILGSQGEVVSHLERQKTWAAQTPQGFRFPQILEAHRQAKESKKTFIDDSEIWDAYIGAVWTVKSSPENRKITYQGDI